MSVQDFIVYNENLQLVFKEQFPGTYELFKYNAKGTISALKAMNIINAYKLKQKIRTGHKGDNNLKAWTDYKPAVLNYLKLINPDARLAKARESMTEKIHRQHYLRFPKWPAVGHRQSGLVNITEKGSYQFSEQKEDYFIAWSCEGDVTVTDIRESDKEYYAEFEGKPTLKVIYVDLITLQIFEKLAISDKPAAQHQVDKYNEVKLQWDMLENAGKPMIHNAVVLVVCIAEFDEQSDLDGVKMDLNLYRNVFENDYGFKVYPQRNGKYDGKFRWSADDIIEFIEDFREKLFRDKHDSLIVVHSGHGGKGTILSSDNRAISIELLHEKVSGAWKHRAAQLPRIFIVDACRGNRGNDCNTEKGNHRAYHPLSNLMTIYGAPVDYVTYCGRTGSYLSRAVTKVLKDNTKQQREFAKLTKSMNRAIQELGGDKQLVIYDGDTELVDLLINSNKY